MRKPAIELLDPAYLSALSGYDLIARLAVEGYISGMHRSRFHGFGTEFLQYRAYTAGEDLRTIDWKAYARRDRLQTKVYQEETNMACHILLDASASMDYRGRRAPCTKFRYACMLASAIAYLASRQGDKVGLYIYKDTMADVVSVRQRSNRLASIYHALQRCEPSGNGDHAAALDFMGHQLGGRGIFVLISDMLEAEQQLPELLSRVRIRHFDTMALQILDPDELDFPTDEAARFVDLETGAEKITSPRAVAADFNSSALAAIEQLRRGMVDKRIDYRRFQTTESLGQALAAFLNHRKLHP